MKAFRPGSWRKALLGQAAVEYLVGVIAAALVLVASTAGDPSPAEELLEALKGFWSNYSYLISMP